MEYTQEDKALLIGRVLGLMRHGHRRDAGALIDKHPIIFKEVITKIVIGEISFDYQIVESVVQLAKDMGYRQEFLI